MTASLFSTVAAILDKAMAEQFADLVDAGVEPTTALERVAGLLVSPVSTETKTLE